MKDYNFEVVALGLCENPAHFVEIGETRDILSALNLAKYNCKSLKTEVLVIDIKNNCVVVRFRPAKPNDPRTEDSDIEAVFNTAEPKIEICYEICY